MYVVVSKEENTVLCLCKELAYLENGYPMDVNRNVSYVKETTQVYEDVEVPEGITVYKYCYMPREGFYENPEYQKPGNALEERVKELEDALAALTAGVEAATGGEDHA